LEQLHGLHGLRKPVIRLHKKACHADANRGHKGLDLADCATCD